MNIYIIRHGQSLMNIGKAKHPNCGLSELGQIQAERIINFFSDKHIDAIYSSPLRRAILTATPLAKVKNLPIYLVPELSEIFKEEWIDHRDYPWENRKQILSEFKNTLFKDIHFQEQWWPVWPESNESAYDRVKVFYEEFLQKYFHTEKKFVIFGHAHTTGDLKKIIHDDTSYPSPNAGIFKFEVDENGICTGHNMYLDHLGTLVTS